MFLQSVMVAARGTRPRHLPAGGVRRRFIDRHAEAIGAPTSQQLVCGMSLGFADPHAIENTLVTEREPVASFVRFLD